MMQEVEKYKAENEEHKKKVDMKNSLRTMPMWQHDRVGVIANDQANHTMSLYVAFTNFKRLIGDAAKN